ncbi:MAG TPA: amidohydrolase family protein, partial [Chitinophagaceae bacterium]
KVTGHLCSITFREAADLGIDDLEHGFFVSSDFEKDKKADQCNDAGQVFSIRDLPVESPAMKDLIAYLVKKNVAVTSTLPVFEPESRREIFPGGGGEAVTPQVREKVEQYHHAVEGKDSLSWILFKKEMAWEKMFVDMGGKLMAGIDPTGAGRVIPGYADRHVIELLTEAGFSVEQAIRICSLNAAEYLGRSRLTGSIEKGKRADLVLIDGDITTDIHAVRKTGIVFKNGTGFDSAKMFEQARGIVGLR